MVAPSSAPTPDAAPKPSSDEAPPQREARGLSLLPLALGAVGVVYGDIGTSPLYSVRECFGEHGVTADPASIYGIMSLVFWSLLVVVVIKYLVYMMRADNNGEGGILALVALIMPKSSAEKKRAGTAALILLGLFGTGLLYGDALITPAISVLSAVEGLAVANPIFAPLTVPIAIVILIGLFLMQRFGTGRIGALFGLVMIVWFAAIAAVGAPWILRNPRVLWGLSPHHAVRFFFAHRFHAFELLGSVVLVVTGGEALYADMGHFGRRAIRLAWFVIVYPGLLLNYFGQGAYLLAHPEGAATSFYALVPRPYLYPMIALATVATVVASQALISGVFSLSQQALQLGYLPRLTVIHTSGHHRGQIYIPEVNELMMFGCIAVVIGFGSSTALAAAYGAAVTGTMAITSVLFYAVMRDRLGKRRALRLLVLFLSFDLAFVGANALKIRHGGWFPLTVGALIFIIMTTWRRGRTALGDLMLARAMPLAEFQAQLEANPPHRVPGAAVFMTSNVDVAPPVLLHHLRHNKVLHERVALLAIETENVPEVPEARRLDIRELGGGLYQATAHYGYMESPNVIRILAAAKQRGLNLPLEETTFYLGRQSLLPTGRSRLARWRKRLFMFLTRNSRSPTYFYGVPPESVIEIGMQIEL
ncbi:MAG: potassium transporter Kup [Polyangia bacterium]